MVKSKKTISSSKLPVLQVDTEKEVSVTSDDDKRPKTPPMQSIEAYFPPSPYGKNRHQIEGDRSIPSRERNVARDFQMMVSANRVIQNSSDVTEQTKRLNAYFRSELLNDTSAWNDFNSDSHNLHGRVYQYTKTSAKKNSCSPEPDFIIPSPNSLQFQTLPSIGKNGRRILMKPTELRSIDTRPFKTLDAPDLVDNFYMNLLDWGPNDCLAVGLGSCVFLWNANNSRVHKLCDLVTDLVTSVKWSSVGSLLSVGTDSGRVSLYDTKHLKLIRTWKNHTMRVGVISWKSNILSTGSRDNIIYHHDVRSHKPHFSILKQHSQEVCGLEWNHEGSMLASGGNDNQLVLWDLHSSNIVHQLNKHTAAIKALSWNPHKRGILASGGGTADKTIKFWNTLIGEMTSSHNVGSQVCNLEWSKKTDEIVSTHGHTDEPNSTGSQIIVWKPNKMKKVATLSGNGNRVTYMTLSHDGDIVITGGSNEAINFWDVFSSVQKLEVHKNRKSCIR